MPVRSAYFGKIPARGDFLSFGAPQATIAALDRFFSEGIDKVDFRNETEAASYMSTPLWQLAARAGVFGPEAILAVMSPSVDKAGRPFPFAIFATFTDDITIYGALGMAEAWFTEVEELILEALEDGFEPSALDKAISVPPLPPAAPGRLLLEGTAAMLTLPLSEENVPRLTVDGAEIDEERLSTLWRTLGGPETGPRSIGTTGLPNAALFEELFLRREAAAG